MNPTLHDRAVGMLLGCAVGDALGVPAETLTREESRERFGMLEDYHVCPADHPFLPDWPAGKWTDDTQLSLAVARALSGGAFDLAALAKEHVRAADETIKGWGRGTRAAVSSLRDGVPPDASGTPEGAGNGVLMKLAPLAFFHAFGPSVSAAEREAQLERFTRMTHAAPAAVATAAIHHALLLRILPLAAGSLGDVSLRRTLLDEIREVALRAERAYGQTEDRMSDRIGRLLAFDHPTEEDVLGIAAGGTHYSPNSLALVYGVFLRASGFEAVSEAANLGGDTDSNAAILGALFGVVEGPEMLPERLLAPLYRREELEETARRFARAVERSQGGLQF